MTLTSRAIVYRHYRWRADRMLCVAATQENGDEPCALPVAVRAKPLVVLGRAHLRQRAHRRRRHRPGPPSLPLWFSLSFSLVFSLGFSLNLSLSPSL